MPVYNDPAGLRRTVPSVFGQTWSGPLRLLVVDDGSTDDTPAVLAELSEHYRGIEVVRNPTNRGRPFSRNRILELAGDDYLAWIDAGDLWHPRKLELQVPALLAAEEQEPDVPIICTGPLRWVFADRNQNRIRVPDVSGDQLCNAILGTIFPYLQAFLAKAEHFRAIGFDDRLLRRQDYDFLVRFLGTGGKVVSTPADVPLFTYLKSDAGGASRVIASSNKTIRQKHKVYYRRYGWRLTRQVGSRQDRLVARFALHNGERLRSFGYRARARLRRPDVVGVTGRAAKSLLSAPQRVWAGRRRVAGSLLRPAARLLGRTGIGRAVGRFRPLRRWAAGGRLAQVLAAPSSAAKPEDLARLEEKVAATEPPPAPEDWLHLEHAYRSRGMLHSAESALRRGLQAHPQDAMLRLRFAEQLPLRRKWSECVDVWRGLDAAGRVYATSTTHTRVARSLREVGDVKGALTVAEEGLRRWPSDSALREEVYLNRSSLVDWHAAIRSAGSPQGGSVGVVDSLGFLVGEEGPIAGRVPSQGSAVPSVSLVVNGVTVATTGGVPAADGHTFSLSCRGMLPYLGDGDVVSVECGGEPLTIEGYGRQCEVNTGYASRFAELAGRLQSGHVFTKFGALRKGNTRQRKRQVLDLFERVSGVLRESHGYPAYPFYGNLLGAVRENDFIGHDVGGFDMGYISARSEPDEVRAEFLEVCRRLIDKGFHLRLEPWSAYVRPNPSGAVYVDVNYAWFTRTGALQFSFGWRYEPVVRSGHVFLQRECPIGDRLVPVPGNAEEVLEQLYGPGWAVPDQGFALDRGLQRNQEYLLTEGELEKLRSYAPDQVLIRTVLMADGQPAAYQGD